MFTSVASLQCRRGILPPYPCIRNTLTHLLVLQVLEIPMVTWKEDKTCGRMAFDEKVQSPAEAKKNLTAMKEHGIFHDEMQIGNEFGTIPDTGGTKICIFNLEKWGNDYSLGWDMNASCKNKNDIVIKRGRPRNRPGQTSAEVGSP